MKNKPQLSFLIMMIVIATLLAGGLHVSAQPRKNLPAKTTPQDEWITYASPSGTFSIRVPERLEHQVTSIGNKRETSIGVDELSWSECVKSIDYYYLRSVHNGVRDRLVIRELDVTPCKEQWDTGLREVEDKFVLSIAGSPYSFKRDQGVRHLGLYGRDIRYDSGEVYPGTKDSAIYNRLFLINTGSRLFLIAYFGKEGFTGEEFSLIQNFRPKVCNGRSH